MQTISLASLDETAKEGGVRACEKGASWKVAANLLEGGLGGVVEGPGLSQPAHFAGGWGVANS